MITASELGQGLRRLRGNRAAAAEIGARAGLPPGLLLAAEQGRRCLSAEELCRVLTELEADFAMLHLALQGRSREEAIGFRVVLEHIFGRMVG
jgi:hypothetical protein